MESQIGYERFFDPDDIFFSTTDAKGVIQRSNRTFDSLSRYTRERLMRSPHNIIRHLDMPAGVFKLMWDDLQAGLPVCAYVINRAADGLDYRVFATIVPIPGGYLSVRTKPMNTRTQEAVQAVYRRVRSREREFAARGSSRRRVGELGAEELTRELDALGFDSLHAMTLETLPHEVSALVSAGVRVPAPPAVEGPVTQILTIAGQIERETNLLVFQLEEYLRLLTSLAAAKGVMLDVAGRTESYARLVGGRELKMADKADAMAYQIIEVSEKVTPALRGLPERMSGLQELVLELRFTVALMRLLTLMVGRFARSVLDGSEEEPVGSMNDLCAALDAGFARLGPLCKEVEQGVAAMDSELREVTPALDRAVIRLRRWVDRDGGGRVSAEVLAEARALAERGTPEVRDLASLAAECRGLHLPFDEEIISQRLARRRALLAQTSSPAAPAGGGARPADRPARGSIRPRAGPSSRPIRPCGRREWPRRRPVWVTVCVPPIRASPRPRRRTHTRGRQPCPPSSLSSSPPTRSGPSRATSDPISTSRPPSGTSATSPSPPSCPPRRRRGRTASSPSTSRTASSPTTSSTLTRGRPSPS